MKKVSGPLTQQLQSLALPVRRRLFPGSARYWEDRYSRGGVSGAGSYGELARFKAEVLNRFVEQHSVASVLEFGCGDGHQLSLANYPTYVGFDVSPSAISRCRETFLADQTKSFFLYSTPHFVDHSRLFHADVTLSLDVLYHLVETDIFEGYLRHLFSAADRYVIVYASDNVRPDAAPHVRHRPFTPWVKENLKEWRLSERIENPIRNTDAVSNFFVFERA